MPSILVDTGVWIALCDPRDQTVARDVIEELYDRIRALSIIVPWPLAYETMRTRLVRNHQALLRFEAVLKFSRIVHLDDAPYREPALKHSFDSSLRRNRPLSMVDCMIRLLLEDIQTKIPYFATFNIADFADICTRRRVEVWSQVRFGT